MPKCRKVHIVAGLMFGDEGKGATTDYLVRKHQAGLVVRYNGGSQAAHNVVSPEGKHHTFSQLGSGTFVPNVKTFLSKHMLIDPVNMYTENDALKQLGIKDAMERTYVDSKAVIITPYHKAVNRLTEWSRDNAHGTCGLGVGVARSLQLEHGDSVLLAGDLMNARLIEEKMAFLQDLCLALTEKLPLEKIKLKKSAAAEINVLSQTFGDDWFEHYLDWPVQIVDSCWVAEELERTEHVVFEGAQGVLLDEVYGTAPHNTWTCTTFRNADAILNDAGYTDTRERIGVIRAYGTRHGAGPFPTQDEDFKLILAEPHNGCSGFQGAFRFGSLDIPAIRGAIQIVGGVDEIALNHLDQIIKFETFPVHVSCEKPRYNLDTRTFPEFLEAELGAPITLLGYGMTAADRKERQSSAKRKVLAANTLG